MPVEVGLASEHADVGSLERLEAALRAPGRLPELRRPAWSQTARAPRRLVTITGEVDLRRLRYRCLGCSTEVIPLDAALGLEPRGQHTLEVRERALWLITEMSYQKAVEVAAELRRWPIGRTAPLGGPRRRPARGRARHRGGGPWVPTPSGARESGVAARYG